VSVGTRWLIPTMGNLLLVRRLVFGLATIPENKT
jgi:hypothetical protein